MKKPLPVGHIEYCLFLNERTAENLAVVSRNTDIHVLGNETGLFTGEDVTELEAVAGSNGETEVVELETTAAVTVGEVEERENVFAVSHVLEEYGTVAAADHHRRTSLDILVDREKLLVLEKLKVEVVELVEVAADHERRLEQAPQSEVSTILDVGAAAVCNVALAVHTADEHIDVIVAVRTGVSELVYLAHSDITEALEAVVDVAGGTVHMCAGGTDPLFDLV